jgi:RNA binding exosome subunit
MASLPVRWIRARTFCQATEEESRVAQALETVLADGEIARETAEGESGNLIVILTRKIESAADVRAAWTRWSDAGLLSALRVGLDSRIDDEGILHLRIDKQKAFQGILAPAGGADTIDVQVKIKAYPAKPAEIRRAAQLLLAEAT